MENLFLRSPINRQAAVVTSQNGCSDQLTTEQLRQNLVRKSQRLREDLAELPKGHWKRKEMGLELYEINEEIKTLKSHKKVRDLSNYIIDVLKERMTKFEWDKTVDEAVRRKKEEEV